MKNSIQKEYHGADLKINNKKFSKDGVLFQESNSKNFINACLIISCPEDFTIVTKTGIKKVNIDDVEITYPNNTLNVLSKEDFLNIYKPVNKSAKELIRNFF